MPLTRPRPRVLVVDDDRRTLSALSELLLDCDFDVASAANGKQALAHAASHPLDVVVSDIRMGECSGLELVRRLRGHTRTADLPVILMSSIDDEVGRIHGLDAGADDFVPKPVDFDQLLARIRVQLRRHEKFEQLRDAATRDELTGILNRRGLLTQLDETLAQSRVEHWPCSALLVDVDRFKIINDQYGHHVGDEVLKGVAQLLRAEMRTTDHVGRLGGDEFVVVLPGATEAAAERIAERLRRSRLVHGDLPAVGLSVGVQQARPKDTLETLLARADEAMYQNKAQRHRESE